MRLGFIGVGAMGKPMAANLLKAGYELQVNDVSEAAVSELVGQGAIRCGTPREAVLGTDVVITMLPNSAIVESVMTGEEGVFAGSKPGQIIIDMSSVDPFFTKNMAAAAVSKGFKYVDAPVSGGVAGASSGSLTIMVGGDKEIVEQIEPILKVLGQKIYHVGQVGSGDAVKVINNLLLGVNMAALGEALVLGVKAGLDPEIMYDIIKVSSGRSYVVETKLPNFILKGNFDAGFAIDLQYKDLELAAATAKKMGMPLPVTTIAQQVFEMARAQGLGREDISAVIKVWENMMGALVRSQ